MRLPLTVALVTTGLLAVVSAVPREQFVFNNHGIDKGSYDFNGFNGYENRVNSFRNLRPQWWQMWNDYNSWLWGNEWNPNQMWRSAGRQDSIIPGSTSLNRPSWNRVFGSPLGSQHGVSKRSVDNAKNHDGTPKDGDKVARWVGNGNDGPVFPDRWRNLDNFGSGPYNYDNLRLWWWGLWNNFNTWPRRVGWNSHQMWTNYDDRGSYFPGNLNGFSRGGRLTGNQVSRFKRSTGIRDALKTHEEKEKVSGRTKTGMGTLSPNINNYHKNRFSKFHSLINNFHKMGFDNLHNLNRLSKFNIRSGFHDSKNYQDPFNSFSNYQPQWWKMCNSRSSWPERNGGWNCNQVWTRDGDRGTFFPLNSKSSPAERHGPCGRVSGQHAVFKRSVGDQDGDDERGRMSAMMNSVGQHAVFKRSVEDQDDDERRRVSAMMNSVGQHAVFKRSVEDQDDDERGRVSPMMNRGGGEWPQCWNTRNVYRCWLDYLNTLNGNSYDCMWNSRSPFSFAPDEKEEQTEKEHFLTKRSASEKDADPFSGFDGHRPQWWSTWNNYRYWPRWKNWMWNRDWNRDSTRGNRDRNSNWNWNRIWNNKWMWNLFNSLFPFSSGQFSKQPQQSMDHRSIVKRSAEDKETSSSEDKVRVAKMVSDYGNSHRPQWWNSWSSFKHRHWPGYWNAGLMQNSYVPGRIENWTWNRHWPGRTNSWMRRGSNQGPFPYNSVDEYQSGSQHAPVIHNNLQTPVWNTGANNIGHFLPSSLLAFSRDEDTDSNTSEEPLVKQRKKRSFGPAMEEFTKGGGETISFIDNTASESEPHVAKQMNDLSGSPGNTYQQQLRRPPCSYSKSRPKLLNVAFSGNTDDYPYKSPLENRHRNMHDRNCFYRVPWWTHPHGYTQNMWNNRVWNWMRTWNRNYPTRSYYPRLCTYFYFRSGCVPSSRPSTLQQTENAEKPEAGPSTRQQTENAETPEGGLFIPQQTENAETPERGLSTRKQTENAETPEGGLFIRQQTENTEPLEDTEGNTAEKQRSTNAAGKQRSKRSVGNTHYGEDRPYSWGGQFNDNSHNNWPSWRSDGVDNSDSLPWWDHYFNNPSGQKNYNRINSYDWSKYDWNNDKMNSNQRWISNYNWKNNWDNDKWNSNQRWINNYDWNNHNWKNSWNNDKWNSNQKRISNYNWKNSWNNDKWNSNRKWINNYNRMLSGYNSSPSTYSQHEAQSSAETTARRKGENVPSDEQNKEATETETKSDRSKRAVHPSGPDPEILRWRNDYAEGFNQPMWQSKFWNNRASGWVGRENRWNGDQGQMLSNYFRSWWLLNRSDRRKRNEMPSMGPNVNRWKGNVNVGNAWNNNMGGPRPFSFSKDGEINTKGASVKERLHKRSIGETTPGEPRGSSGPWFPPLTWAGEYSPMRSMPWPASRGRSWQIRGHNSLQQRMTWNSWDGSRPRNQWNFLGYRDSFPSSSPVSFARDDDDKVRQKRSSDDSSVALTTDEVTAEAEHEEEEDAKVSRMVGGFGPTNTYLKSWSSSRPRFFNNPLWLRYYRPMFRSNYKYRQWIPDGNRWNKYRHDPKWNPNQYYPFLNHYQKGPLWGWRYVDQMQNVNWETFNNDDSRVNPFIKDDCDVDESVFDPLSSHYVSQRHASNHDAADDDERMERRTSAEKSKAAEGKQDVNQEDESRPKRSVVGLVRVLSQRRTQPRTRRSDMATVNKVDKRFFARRNAPDKVKRFSPEATARLQKRLRKRRSPASTRDSSPDRSNPAQSHTAPEQTRRATVPGRSQSAARDREWEPLSGSGFPQNPNADPRTANGYEAPHRNSNPGGVRSQPFDYGRARSPFGNVGDCADDWSWNQPGGDVDWNRFGELRPGPATGRPDVDGAGKECTDGGGGGTSGSDSIIDGQPNNRLSDYWYIDRDDPNYWTEVPSLDSFNFSREELTLPSSSQRNDWIDLWASGPNVWNNVDDLDLWGQGPWGQGTGWDQGGGDPWWPGLNTKNNPVATVMDKAADGQRYGDTRNEDRSPMGYGGSQLGRFPWWGWNPWRYRVQYRSDLDEKVSRRRRSASTTVNTLDLASTTVNTLDPASTAVSNLGPASTAVNNLAPSSTVINKRSAPSAVNSVASASTAVSRRTGPLDAFRPSSFVNIPGLATQKGFPWRDELGPYLRILPNYFKDISNGGPRSWNFNGNLATGSGNGRNNPMASGFPRLQWWDANSWPVGGARVISRTPPSSSSGNIWGAHNINFRGFPGGWNVFSGGSGPRGASGNSGSSSRDFPNLPGHDGFRQTASPWKAGGDDFFRPPGGGFNRGAILRENAASV